MLLRLLHGVMPSGARLLCVRGTIRRDLKATLPLEGFAGQSARICTQLHDILTVYRGQWSRYSVRSAGTAGRGILLAQSFEEIAGRIHGAVDVIGIRGARIKEHAGPLRALVP